MLLIHTLADLVIAGDPSEIFTDLVQIAEGDSGDVFSANVTSGEHKSEKVNIKDIEVCCNTTDMVWMIEVAVKQVAFTAHDKLEVIAQELRHMRASQHPNIVAFYGCYVDETMLWVS
jgi:serine/threonine protein kinase